MNKYHKLDVQNENFFVWLIYFYLLKNDYFANFTFIVVHFLMQGKYDNDDGVSSYNLYMDARTEAWSAYDDNGLYLCIFEILPPTQKSRNFV